MSLRTFTSAFVLVFLLAAPARSHEFPAIPGWTLTGKPLTFDTRTIWKAINGAAELYIAFGFQKLMVQDYQKADVRVSLNVYDQSLPINAWGVFHKERSPQAKPLDAGAEAAVAPPYQCVLLKEQFYVKAEATQGKLSEALCLELVQAMAGILPGKNHLPKELKRLPAALRVAGSEGYTRQGFLGLTELNDCLHASYKGKGTEPHQLFVILTGPGKGADPVWNKLSSRWKATQVGKLPALTREIPYRGAVVIVKTEDGILGATDAGDLPATLGVLQEALQ